jgi:F0F1-type ATP synthase membrane subunit b/b'
MTDLHSSQIRSLAEAANNITNPITKVKTVEEVETVEEGVLGNVAKKIIQKIKDIKSDYAEWRDLAKQLSQLKQERDSVLADIQVSAQKRLKELDTEMQKAALKAIKELNAELDRLKVTDKERLGETVEEVAEVETVEEAVAIDKNMNIKAVVAVLKDISDALMGKNVVTQRERLMAIAQVLASKRGFV